MKKLMFILILFNNTIYAQDSIRITGTLTANSKFAKVVMLNYDLQQKVIAIANINKDNNQFKIAVPSTIEAGVYKLQYSQNDPTQFTNIIIDGKEMNIDYSLIVSGQDRNPIFSTSSENKNWIDYNNQSQKQLTKIDILHQTLTYYPDKKDEIVAQTYLAYENEKIKYKTQLTEFLNQNKNTWVAEMVANNTVYFPDPTEHPVAQEYKRRENYWKNINTTNPKLLNTPLYSEHILNYLKFYMNPDMKFSEDEMQKGFIKSVDTIMQKFGGNPETKKFALKYLQAGFKQIGQEKVLQYIDTKYKETIQQCQNDTEKEQFDNRMKGYQAMKPGRQAPEISFEKDGKKHELKDIKTDKTIIAFWASWCPNCEKQIPLLEEYIKNNPTITAITVSLDDDKNAYQEAIKKFPNLIHTCDFKKWQGKTATDYYIVGTPTFIILDKEKKIIDKFPSWELVLKELEKK